MVAQRMHADEEWRELGQHLYHAHEALTNAYIKASEMWGTEEHVLRRIRERHTTLGTLRFDPSTEETWRKWHFLVREEPGTLPIF